MVVKIKFFQISLFLLCIDFGFILVVAMGLFGASTANPIGPAGLDVSGTLKTSLAVAGLVAILIAGGITWAGISFKSSATAGIFLTIYGFSTTMLATLLAQIFSSAAMTLAQNALITGIITGLFTFVGIEAALEIGAGAIIAPIE